MRWLVLAIVLAGCTSLEPADGSECHEPLADWAGGTPHLVLYWDLDGTSESSGILFETQVFDGSTLVAEGSTRTDCIVFDMGTRHADRFEMRAVDDERTFEVLGAIDFQGEFLLVDVPV